MAQQGAAAAWPAVRPLRAPRPRAADRLERLRATVPAVDLVLVAVVATALGAPGLMACAMAVGCVATLLSRGVYAARLRPTVLEGVPHGVLAATVGAVLAVGCRVYVDGAVAPAAGLVLALAVCSAAGLTAVRTAVVVAHRRAWRRGARLPVILVGAGRVADVVRRRLESDLACGLRPVACLDDGGFGDAATGSLGDLERVCARHGARHVVVAFSGDSDERLTGVIRDCERLGLQVWVVPRLFDVINHRSSYEPIGGLPLLGLHSISGDDWRFSVKHGIDRVAALVLLIALAPVMAACALAVRLSSPGPVIFRQRRVGCDGREFEILKFRSMCPGAAAPADRPRAFAQTAPGGVEGEDRRTPVGRFLRRTSLDELPQLINVLCGEMSLVGPRPERPEFVELFNAFGRYRERHRVRSGITGWAQVHGLRGQTSLADRIAYDNHYIEHWSFGLDLRTLALTVLAVFRSAE